MPKVIALYRERDGSVKAGPAKRQDQFIPVIDLVLQYGWLGRKLLTPVCTTHDQADRTRKGLYTSARYYCSCGARHCTRKYSNVPREGFPEGGCPNGGQRVSCRADIVKDKDGKLRVQVTLYDKREATREVIRKYGPDPSQWPYQAKARKIDA